MRPPYHDLCSSRHFADEPSPAVVVNCQVIMVLVRNSAGGKHHSLLVEVLPATNAKIAIFSDDAPCRSLEGVCFESLHCVISRKTVTVFRHDGWCSCMHIRCDTAEIASSDSTNRFWVRLHFT